jgi:hypothetical protein
MELNELLLELGKKIARIEISDNFILISMNFYDRPQIRWDLTKENLKDQNKTVQEIVNELKK